MLGQRKKRILISLGIMVLGASCGTSDLAPTPGAPPPETVQPIEVDRPLFRDEFTEAAEQGFGTRHNTKAWSMIWWKDKLFVGTARAHKCVQDAALAFRVGGIFKYPPKDPDVECTEMWQDLPLRGEIWAFAPETEAWERLFQSPEDLEIDGYPGKFVARDIGFRDMELFVDPEDGEERLYTDGVCSETINPNIGPPRILRSENGTEFEPVPQEPGTVLGNLGFKQASMRSMTTYDDRLFIVIGEVRGNGVLYESRDPAGGNDNFRIVSPPGMQVYEMCTFNGYLYLGLVQDDPLEGYFVVKTDAAGEPPYKFTPVVTQGGHLEPIPSNTVVSMCVFRDRLYVGTDKPAEIVRINPDDTWDLIVGAARDTPDGWKAPLSGMYSGFNWVLNEHIWRMAEHEGWLYIGTNDMTSLNMKNWPIMDGPYLGAVLRAQQGYDLAATRDGVYYTIIDRAGFGDGLEIGIRNFVSTPHGLFFGTSNPYYGLRIWRGQYSDPEGEITPPRRLEGESRGDATLLTWDHPGGAARFRVHRASGNNPPREIGETNEKIFIDAALESSYNVYHVTAEREGGEPSRPSNTFHIPTLAPPATFDQAMEKVVGLGEQGKFESPDAEAWYLDQLTRAREALHRNRAGNAETILLQAQERAGRNEGDQEGSALMEPYCAEDLELLLRRLIKRVWLVKAGELLPEDMD
jgi:hypothetical protein